MLRVRTYCSLVGRLHYQDRRSCFPLSGISRPVVKYASTCGLGSGRACSTASPTAFCAINPKSRGVHVRSQHGDTWFVGLEETPEGGEDVLLEGTRVLWLARSGTLQDPPVWPTVADGADVHRPCHYLSQSCAFALSCKCHRRCQRAAALLRAGNGLRCLLAVLERPLFVLRRLALLDDIMPKEPRRSLCSQMTSLVQRQGLRQAR